MKSKQKHIGMFNEQATKFLSLDEFIEVAEPLINNNPN
jgi:hypothetical protein